MPISYSVDQSRRLILTVWAGDVTASEVKSFWKQQLADPEVLPIRRTLADLRQCTSLVTGSDMCAGSARRGADES